MTPEPITAELRQRRGHAVVRLPLYRRYIAGLWTVGRKLEDLERGHWENMQTPCNSSRYGNQTHNLLAFQGYDWPVSEFRISSTHEIAREFYRHWQKKNKRKIVRKVRAVQRPLHVTNVPRRKRTIQKQKKGNLSRSLIDPRPPCCRGLTMKDISKARVFGHWCRRMATYSR